jgi:hypothetical protein
MDIATFRQSFPEFADASAFPDPMITFWISVSGNFVDQTIWQDSYDYGMSLVLAHHLAIAAKNQKGNPGNAAGLVNNKSVGDVSVAFDTQATAEEGAGFWNLTAYGQQYLRMARFMGGCARYI